MDARALKELVDDYGQWRGNVFTLAAIVAAAQREIDAVKAEEAGQPDLAVQIRAG